MTTIATHRDEEYHGRFSLRVWRAVLRYAKPYWLTMLAVALCGMGVAGLDALVGLLTRYVIDDVVRQGRSAPFTRYAWLYAAVTVGFPLCGFVFIRLAGKLSTVISRDIRQAGFNHLQDLSFSFYDRRPAGWLVARLTSDCDRLARTIAWGTLDVVWGIFLTLGLSVIMVWVHWRLGLLVLSVLPAVAWVSLYFQRMILATSREVRRQNSALTAAFAEAISGVRTTKTLAREQENLQEFSVLSRKMYDTSVLNEVQSGVFYPIVFTLGSAAAGVALWVGGNLQGSGDISVGTLVLFLSYACLFVRPVLEVARRFADLQSTQASAERVIGLIQTPPQVTDSPQVQEAIRQWTGRERPAGVAIDGGRERIGQIEFRNVDFQYVSNQPVLKGFNLTVTAGQSVALVGPTGGGKSTIVSLLCRFYEPTGGQILLDGVEYRDRGLLWLQSNLGIVLQQAHLFSGTVRENIRYGRLGATDEEVERAARLVRAHEFIQQLDKGYDTNVGEGGGRLSTGQKQLVSFARAVLANPQVFVMDEATSSVDTRTEQLIQQALEAMLAGRFSFIIAHRLSTIRRADVILVIEGGRIVEQGNHAQLLERRGRYFELYTRQFVLEQEGALLGAAMPSED